MTVPYKSVSDELAILMDQVLKSDENESKTGANRINEGLYCLDKAAGIFEHLHEKEAAEAITIIIEKMSGVK